MAKLLPEPSLTAKRPSRSASPRSIGRKTRIDKLADDDRRLRAERQSAADALSGAQANSMRLSAEATTHEATAVQAAQDASTAAAQSTNLAKALGGATSSLRSTAGRDSPPLIERRVRALHGTRTARIQRNRQPEDAHRGDREGHRQGGGPPRPGEVPPRDRHPRQGPRLPPPHQQLPDVHPRASAPRARRQTAPAASTTCRRAASTSRSTARTSTSSTAGTAASAAPSRPSAAARPSSPRSR